MNQASMIPTSELPVRRMARLARMAARQLATLSDAQRCEVLLANAAALWERRTEILAANERDLSAAARAVAVGRMKPALRQRLQTNERGVAEMADRVRDVASLRDPLGCVLAATELDEGLTLYKKSCPLGVIAIIFEARPDVIPQVAALALKSANAVIFKGGTEASYTNEVLAAIWRDGLAQFPNVPIEAISILQSHAQVAELLKLQDEIDLIIPRGSRELVRYVAESSRIPVLGHGEGVCHVYIDRAADLEKGFAVAFDSKVQYPAACNAMETLLVHEEIAPAFLPEMIARFRAAKVEVRGCELTIALGGFSDLIPASNADWEMEYSDLIVSIKVVASAETAIEHIERHGSGHTESIVTEDQELARKFLNVIDAAGVYHNASTRFADGFRYGLGAELGISTGKLHARGPVGLAGLTTYKYELIGAGHTVATYSGGERSFNHRALL